MSIATENQIDPSREDRVLKALSSFRIEIIEEMKKLKQLLITTLFQNSLDHSVSRGPVNANAVNLLNEMFQTKMQEFISVADSISTTPSCHPSKSSVEPADGVDHDELFSQHVSDVDVAETHFISSHSENACNASETSNVKSEVSEQLQLLNSTGLTDTSSIGVHQDMICGPGTSDSDLICYTRTDADEIRQDFSLFSTSSKQTFPCNDCGKVFTSKSDFRKHLRIHTGVRPYKCSLCGKSFTQKSSLKYHINVHTGEKPFKCSKCEKSFIHRGNLNNHIRKHRHEDPPNCK